MTKPSIPQLINQLNIVSDRRWGDDAPSYSYLYDRSKKLYYVHRIRKNISPFLPADELFSRGDADHVAAKIRQAIEHAKLPVTRA